MATSWWLENYYNRVRGSIMKRRWNAEPYDVDELRELALYEYLLSEKGDK